MSQPRTTRPIESVDHLGPISLHRLDLALLLLIVGFVVLVLIDYFSRVSAFEPFSLLLILHNHVGRFTLLLSVIMLAMAAYIGLIRHADVTPYFLRGAYVVWGTLVAEVLLGGAMYLLYNARPAQEVHLIYGAGAFLSLPFFYYVERTSPKRPAMGSYLWGFALMAGIIIRCLSTGVL
jgi:hypothetical protein